MMHSVSVNNLRITAPPMNPAPPVTKILGFLRNVLKYALIKFKWLFNFYTPIKYLLGFFSND